MKINYKTTYYITNADGTTEVIETSINPLEMITTDRLKTLELQAVESDDFALAAGCRDEIKKRSGGIRLDELPEKK